MMSGGVTMNAGADIPVESLDIHTVATADSSPDYDVLVIRAPRSLDGTVDPLTAAAILVKRVRPSMLLLAVPVGVPLAHLDGYVMSQEEQIEVRDDSNPRMRVITANGPALIAVVMGLMLEESTLPLLSRHDDDEDQSCEGGTPDLRVPGALDRATQALER